MATPVVTPNATQQQVQQTVTALPEGAQVQTPAAPVTPAVQTPVVTAPTETLKSETPEVKVFDIGAGKFRYEYATGEKFSGTLEEIASNTAKAHVQTKQWAQQNRQQPTTPVTPQLTPEQQAELAAQNYVTDMVAKSLGFKDGTELKSRVSTMSESTEQFAGRMLAAEFQASSPDFNPTPENSTKLTKIIDDAGLPYNLTTLQMAHSHALRSKIYEPLAAQTQQPTVLIPPLVQSNGSAVNQTSNLMEANINMTADQLKAKLDAARAAGVR